jgi:hypothetical protein
MTGQSGESPSVPGPSGGQSDHRKENQARFEYQGFPEELVAALTAQDYGLLNDARVAVLRRLSGECLYEFHTLHGAALLFREAVRTSSASGT